MARRRAYKRTSAQRDIVECALFIAKDQPLAAERFLDAVEETVRLLAEHPHAGRVRDFGNPRLEGLRCRPVEGFKNFLLFYFPTDEGIDVFHVYHGARDLPPLFEEDEGD
ncbi:MAG TPA: type II toxin-antitoxin system RelE/ParE family toxin [Planctomycetota bacterium]|nr:type II toxin-antitoxin system RelE/ParE family toxin [Planctomycetota bacterium]